MFVSKCCQGEKCFCGRPAEHKVCEEIFYDDPYPARHGLTTYLCFQHFKAIMRPAADRGREQEAIDKGSLLFPKPNG